jgi:serine protease Do
MAVCQGKKLCSVTAIFVVLASVTSFAWAQDKPAQPTPGTDIVMNGGMGMQRSALLTRVLPTVVNITVRKPQEQDSPLQEGTVVGAAVPDASNSEPVIKSYVGSGFVIDPSGTIVTNYHVVENAYEIAVGFSDGTVLPGKTLHASRLADLALIKVEPKHPLPAAQWGDSTKLQVGDQVFAAGNPFGIGLSVSSGIVSGLNRDIQNSPYDDLIQTDATINHGNSGGPLFDMQGNVVGVDSAIISPTAGSAGIGFAVPSSTAKFVFDRLEKYGWIRPAWIGIKLQRVTPDLALAMGMDRADGSIVAWVLPGSPSEKAGLKIGDVVLRFNDQEPTDDRALLRDIAHTTVGDTITFTIQRDNAQLTVPVKVAEWPRDQWDQRDAPSMQAIPKDVIPANLGVTVAPIPQAQKVGLGLGPDVAGVVVTGIAANSDATRRGLAKGDVILRVRDKSVATPADMQSAIDAARAEKRRYVMVLVLPKIRQVPGPTWLSLALPSDQS